MTQIPLYRPEGGTIAELLMRQGDIAARRAAQSGEIWGNALANLGQIAGGAVQQYQQQKEGKKREAVFREVVSTWDPSDPRGFMMRLASVSGPDDAMKFTMGLMAFEESVKKKQQGQIPTMEETKAALVAANTLRKNAPMLFEEQYPNLMQTYGSALEQHFGLKNLPGQPTEDVVRALDALSREWDQGKTKYQPVTTAAGIQPFDPGTGTLGAVIGQPPPEAKESKIPTLDQQLAEAYQKGDQTAIANILTLKAREAAATRAPKTVEPPKEYVFNPEGEVLSSYGLKEREEVRKQAAERGIPIFVNATTQVKGVTLKSIAADAMELKSLLADKEVKGSIGLAAGNWARLKSRFVDLPPKVQRAMQLLASLSDTELRKRSGAQINEKEFQRLLQFTTDPRRPLGHNLTAIEGLLKSATRDYRALSGVNPFEAEQRATEDLGGGLQFLGEGGP